VETGVHVTEERVVGPANTQNKEALFGHFYCVFFYKRVEKSKGEGIRLTTQSDGEKTPYLPLLPSGLLSNCSYIYCCFFNFDMVPFKKGKESKPHASHAHTIQHIQCTYNIQSQWRRPKQFSALLFLMFSVLPCFVL
jgi:hypothetical protein